MGIWEGEGVGYLTYLAVHDHQTRLVYFQVSINDKSPWTRKGHCR